MKHFFSLALACFLSCFVQAQSGKAYQESIKSYIKKYVDEHEVVGKKDKKYFRFFPVSEAYRVACVFEKINDTTGLIMHTSAGTIKSYFKYGKLSFSIRDTPCVLYVYQSTDLMKTQEYKDYLFVPFTDATTGDESYGSGRYIDFRIGDIKGNSLQLDFNKAYNPYCAYATGYRCPVPPKENHLTIAIRAGEMNFGKKH
ncbi:MAG: DUF1684 domain-containing protein [Ferruginibacter sp.]